MKSSDQFSRLEYLENKSRQAYDIFKRTGSLKLPLSILAKLNTPGLLMSGQILEQLAYDTKDTEHLYRACEYFNQVIEIESDENPSRILTAARIRQLQLPIDLLIVGSDQLPSTQLAKNVFSKTLIAAHEFKEASSTFLSKEPASVESAKIKGILGETAVLLTLKRVAIEEIGTKSWYPVLSKLSEDNNGKTKSGLNRSWDISIYDQTFGVDSPAHKLQIKWAFHSPGQKNYDEEVDLIHVDPILRRDQREKNIAALVIDELMREHQGDNTVSFSLDERKDQLLDAIG